MSVSTSLSSVEEQVITPENGVEQIQLLAALEDSCEGVLVDMKGYQPLDIGVFTSLLRASMSLWKQQGKNGIWIKLPIRLSNLIDVAVKEGFRYHHAKPDYLILVNWIPETIDTLPPNASHRVDVGAFVINSKRETFELAAFEVSNGRTASGASVAFLKTQVYGSCQLALSMKVKIFLQLQLERSKKRLGFEAEFVEVLAFSQSHEEFIGKSDLFFVCMLKPHSFDIQKQNLEIAAAQRMPIEDYPAQPFVKQNKLFDEVA